MQNADIEEYIAGTNPTNPASFFPHVALVVSTSSAGRLYGVLAATYATCPRNGN